MHRSTRHSSTHAAEPQSTQRRRTNASRKAASKRPNRTPTVTAIIGEAEATTKAEAKDMVPTGKGMIVPRATTDNPATILRSARVAHSPETGEVEEAATTETTDNRIPRGNQLYRVTDAMARHTTQVTAMPGTERATTATKLDTSPPPVEAPNASPKKPAQRQTSRDVWAASKQNLKTPDQERWQPQKRRSLPSCSPHHRRSWMKMKTDGRNLRISKIRMTPSTSSRLPGSAARRSTAAVTAG